MCSSDENNSRLWSAQRTLRRVARFVGVAFDGDRFAECFDDIADAKLPAATGLDLAVDLHLAALNQHLGVPACRDEPLQLEELVEVDRLFLRSRSVCGMVRRWLLRAIGPHGINLEGISWGRVSWGRVSWGRI